MSKSIIPTHLRYSQNHEWALASTDDTVLVGITDHAQRLLGDLVFVEIPEVGRAVSADESCAVIESVKAASDVYSPLDGVIVEVNESLADSPELINQDPYGEGWIFRLKTTASVDGLLDAIAYEALARADDEEEGSSTLANPALV
ncbi:MAG: glycine cleavage system protein GcvH [Rhizobiaceae bacterium]